MSFLLNKLLVTASPVCLSLSVSVSVFLCLSFLDKVAMLVFSLAWNWLHISPLLAVTESTWIRDTMTNNSRSTCGVLGIGLLHTL